MNVGIRLGNSLIRVNVSIKLGKLIDRVGRK